MPLIRAKYILWKAGEKPIEDGALIVRGSRINAVGRFSDLRKKIRGRWLDLGEVVVLPGLVNAHCHLNYTHMAGKIPPPASFTRWIEQFLPLKLASTPDDFGVAVKQGLRQLQDSGTTTVCDIASDTNASELSTQAFEKNFKSIASSPLRVWSCLEFYDAGRAVPLKARLDKAFSVAVANRRARGGYGLSPHAPYTTSAALYELTTRIAKRRHLLLTTHIAESEDEWQMFWQRRGELFELLKRYDADLTHCGGTTPVEWLQRLGVLTPRCIGAHMNYLTPSDFETIARSRMSVVHCPRSHEYFRHRKFPLQRLLKLDVNVCLGTDSAATNATAHPLSMFEEMRTLRHRQPSISPDNILRMATLNGAHALGQQKNFGSIEIGKFADLIAVPVKSNPKKITDEIIAFRPPVPFLMVGGTIPATA